MKWSKRFRIIAAALILICVAVLSIGGYLKISKVRKTSENIEMGNQYLSELNYEQAIASYRSVLSIDPKNKEAKMGLAEAYESSHMYSYAEETYKDLLLSGSSQPDVYYKLVNLYISQGEYEEAGALLEEAVRETDDEGIEQLYAEAHPAMPKMNYDSGTYQERIKIEISAEEAGQIVYYTTDGTEPDKESLIYGKPIVLPNGNTDIKAVAVNSLGFSSDIVASNYNIDIRDEEVEIQEPIIEQIVRDEMQIPYGEPIYNDDIERITELYVIGTMVASGSDKYNVSLEEEAYTVDGYTYTVDGWTVIYSLQDLRMMPFLERVVIAYQPDLDISGIAGLESLKELSLVGDNLTNNDISALSGLNQLQVLNLGWNDISDIGAVTGMKDLVSLGLWGNNIRSIQGIENMELLEYLDVSDNSISSVSPAQQLENLQQLWMYSNKVADISDIANLPRLNVLMLYDNPINNMETLRSIYPRLKRIDVDVLNLKDKES